MAVNKAELKPSLQRILDVREAVKARIAQERIKPESDSCLVLLLKKEQRQLKRLFVHMSLQKRIRVTSEYVFNMTDGTLDVLREFIDLELQGMLRCMNEKNRIYIDCEIERKTVIAEQQKRKQPATCEASVAFAT
jgi:hypothetical protein